MRNSLFLFLAMLPMVMTAQISKNVTVANAGHQAFTGNGEPL